MEVTPVKSGRRVLGDVVNIGTPFSSSKSLKDGSPRPSPNAVKRDVLSPDSHAIVGKKRTLDQANQESDMMLAPRSPDGTDTQAVDKAAQSKATAPPSTADFPMIDESVLPDPPRGQSSSNSTNTMELAEQAPPTPLSQETAPTVSKCTPFSATPTSTVSSSEDAVSHAQVLQLRLRLAMFKINTNQASLPFASLQLSRHAPTRTPSIHDAAVTDRPSSTTQHEQAPRLLLPPLSLPAADASRRLPELFPSSPPDSAGYEDDTTMADAPAFATPRLPRDRVNHQPAQLSSPPDSQGGEDLLPEVNLTSSIVRGRAATGLLELKRTI